MRLAQTGAAPLGWWLKQPVDEVLVWADVARAAAKPKNTHISTAPQEDLSQVELDDVERAALEEAANE